MKHDFGYFEEDHLGQVADMGLWRRILFYSLFHWKKIGGSILLSTLVISSTLTIPYIIKIGIDGFILNEVLSNIERVGGLARLGAFFILIMLIGFIANFAQVILLELTGQKIMHRIRQQLFRHLMKLNLKFFNNNPAGKLVTRLTNDIQNMHEMFTSVVVTIFNDFFQLIGIFIILFLMNWKLSLIILLLLPIIIGNTLWFSKLARNAFRTIRTHLARINSYIQESLSGISVIQIFMRQGDTYHRFGKLSNDYLRKNLYQIRIFGIFMPAMEFLSALGIGCVIWYGGGEVLRKQLTLGELVAFLSYIRLFFQPLRELSQKYSIVQSAMASAERIFQLLDTPVASEELPLPARDHVALDGHVVFKNVFFGYDKNQKILNDLSFEVPAGSSLAIVGATGAGKTTIINLLEKFYEPDKGCIKLSGQDIKTIDTNWLRKQIGLVMQDIFILPATIRENILLDGEISNEQFETILQQSQLQNFIDTLADGVDTQIGEGGMDLSAGQKQLLSFARVLARNPKILMLDEATSNVDSETEMHINRALTTAMTGRTSIIIAHRLSTIQRTDSILVMDQGKIVEQGNHETLIRKDGYYQHLYELQFRSDNFLSSA